MGLEGSEGAQLKGLLKKKAKKKKKRRIELIDRKVLKSVII